MPPDVKVGSILIDHPPLTNQRLGIVTEDFYEGWNLVQELDGFALEAKTRAAGWHFLFMAAERKVMFWGIADTKRLRKALLRILSNAKNDPFNSPELTRVVEKRFLGIPYTLVSAHSCHIQKSRFLASVPQRKTRPPGRSSSQAVRAFPPGGLTYESK